MYLEGEGFAGAHFPRIDNVGGGVTNVVVKEDLQSVPLPQVQEEGLAGVRPLIPALPEGIVVPNCECPAADVTCCASLGLKVLQQCPPTGDTDFAAVNARYCVHPLRVYAK